jgi:hypothetical protein
MTIRVMLQWVKSSVAVAAAYGHSDNINNTGPSPWYAGGCHQHHHHHPNHYHSTTDIYKESSLSYSYSFPNR